jgi:hypothetical protein
MPFDLFDEIVEHVSLKNLYKEVSKGLERFQSYLQGLLG